MASLIVADANWVVALGDVFHTRAIVLNLKHDGDRIVLHPLTLAECLVGAAQPGQLEQRSIQLRSAFEIPDVDKAAPERWTQLRSTSRLRLPDVIVLDTALQNAATRILKFDQQLASHAKRHGIQTPGSEDS